MSTLPERIIRTRSGDGSISHSEVYTLDNWNNREVAGVIFGLIIAISVVPFAPAFLLCTYLFSGGHDNRDNAYWAIGIALYVLIDFFNVWWLNSILISFSDKGFAIFYLTLNIAVLVTAVACLVLTAEGNGQSGGTDRLSKAGLGILIMFMTWGPAAYLFNESVIKFPRAYFSPSPTPEKEDSGTSGTSSADAHVSDSRKEEPASIKVAETSNNESVQAEPDAMEPVETKEVVNGETYTRTEELTVGGQTWSGKNLNTVTFRNGDIVPQAATAQEWKDAATSGKPAWCYAQGQTDERLYNWYAVNDSRGLAPEGWHVASAEEWLTLLEELGGFPEALLRIAVPGFLPSGTGVENTGFGAEPLGMRYNFGNGYSMEPSAYFWTSSESESGLGHYQPLEKDCFNPERKNVIRWGIDKGTGMSVRCVRD